MIVKTAISTLTTASDVGLIGICDGVVTGLTDNPSFADPAPKLSLVSDTLAAFRTAVAEAVNGGKELTATKNAGECGRRDRPERLERCRLSHGGVGRSMAASAS